MYTKIFYILFFVLILKQVNSTDITLTGSLSDTTTDEYTIEDKVLTIKANGNYKISGSCSECQIVIDKGLEVTITLDSITIDNSNTGPFVIKKNSIVNLNLSGESTITDNESEENEDSDDFEGAGIKFKSSSTLTISGGGKLKVVGNAKNGIKGASLSTLIINSGTFEILVKKNALACDHILKINGGKFIIESEGDGIKVEPDSDDDDSRGMLIIYGGDFTINTKSDAIQAGFILEINGGKFNIKTLDGTSTKNFDKDTDSAKGIKCSTNEHENVENVLTIKGGEFTLNTIDDAIHSDYNLTILGGTFEINTGDDGIHADKFLILGENGADNSLINIKIKESLEGIEGATIYIYSGTYNIIASDDGINSAGNSSLNCGGNEPNTNQNGPNAPDGTNPPNGPNRPNMNRNLRGRNLQGMNPECTTFHIYIYGGEIYVNAGADGLDANGDIYINGGELEIWGAKSGSDGDPFDREGKLTISNAIVLAGGNQGMTPVHQSSTINQKYIYATQSFSENKEISILNGNNKVKTINIPKNIQYLFYTSPDTTDNYKFSEGTTYTASSNNNNNPGNFGNNPPPNNPPSDNTDSTDSTDDTNDDMIRMNISKFLMLNYIALFLLSFIF